MSNSAIFRSGPGHDRELCIHPASPHLQNGEDIQCLMHKEDAIEVCVRLEGCVAVSCFPEDNYESLDPSQFRSDQGILMDQREPTERLLVAAESGNLEQLVMALKSGADVDAVDPIYERTALMMAARRGDVQQVRELLNAGASTRIKDRQHLSALDHSRAFSTPESAIQDTHLVYRSPYHKQIAVENYPEVENILSEHEFETALANDRLAHENILSEDHNHALLKDHFATMPMEDPQYSSERTRTSVEVLYRDYGIHGPVCVARAHQTINEPRSERCSANPTRPQPRCANIRLEETLLADLVMMDRLPTRTARKLHPGLAAGRMLLAFPPHSEGELWYQHWRLGVDVLGDAPTRGGGYVTLAFVPEEGESSLQQRSQRHGGPGF